MGWNIAIVRMDSGNYGGVEHQVIKLIKQLMNRGNKVYLITSNPDSLMSKNAAELSCSVFVCDFNDIISCSKTIASFCLENNIEILQSHMFRENIICRFVKKKHRNILNIFRAHTYIDCGDIPEIKKIAYHILDFCTQKYVDKYVSINSFNVKEMKKRSGISKNKIVVINNIIDNIASGINCDVVWPINEIAMIANFVPVKGHKLLLQAVKELVSEGLNFHLRLIGGASNENQKLLEECKVFVDKNTLNEHVEFVGFSNDVVNEIRDCSAVVLTSYSEGTPNCLLEAMTMKKLVISSNVGGISEFAKDDNSILYFPNTVENIKNSLKKALSMSLEEYLKYTNNGYKAANTFIAQDIAEQFTTLYEQELGGRPSAR